VVLSRHCVSLFFDFHFFSVPPCLPHTHTLPEKSTHARHTTHQTTFTKAIIESVVEQLVDDDDDTDEAFEYTIRLRNDKVIHGVSAKVGRMQS
jgi:hypothetical protein